MHSQCAIKNADGTLLFIAKGIECKSRQVEDDGEATSVQNQSLYSQFRKDAGALRVVLRRFTRLIPGMGRLSYEIG